jgi:hypothetical protein
VWEHYFSDTKSVQTSRHAVFDEHKHFIDHGDPDTRARHALELSTKIAALEARSAPPTNGKKPVPSVLKEALAQDHYLVCNAAVIDKATCYIRDRNVEHHGKLISECIGTKYKKGTSKKTYTPNDCAYYDLRCMWSTTSAVCPPPYVWSAPPIAYNRLLAVVAPVSHGPISSADQAALEAIHPVVDTASLASPPPPQPTLPPKYSDAEIEKRIGDMDLSLLKTLTTADRVHIQEFLHHNRNPTICTEWID